MEPQTQTQMASEQSTTTDSDKVVYDASKDVILTDDEGDRIATMREYVFLHLATSCN